MKIRYLSAEVPCFHKVKKHCLKNEWMLMGLAKLSQLSKLAHFDQSLLFFLIAYPIIIEINEDEY